MQNAGKTTLAVLSLTVLVSLNALLVTYSKRAGAYNYLPEAVVTASEAMKAFITAGIMIRQGTHADQHGGMSPYQRLKEALIASVPLAGAPAVIYGLQNNLQYVALLYLSAPSYQVLSNLKIVSAAIMVFFVLKRPVTRVQWCGVLLVALGSAVSQLPSPHSALDEGPHTQLAFPIAGILVVCVICLLSGLGSVVSEYLVKGKGHDLHYQNIQMYKWGVLFDLSLLWFRRGDAVMSGGFFQGWTPVTWVIMLNNAVLGLAVSFVLKHANSIVKSYAAACAMLFTAVVSIQLFGDQPTPQLFLGIGIVSIAIYLHSIGGAPKAVTKPSSK